MKEKGIGLGVPLVRRSYSPNCPTSPQDHVVLLPSAHYEAAVLQLRITEPCTFQTAARLPGEK